MDNTKLRTMIESFFEATLTANEERELCCYLRNNDVPAELHKDKEAILALCSDESVEASSAEAFARVEAMIDALETEQQPQPTETHQMPNIEKGKIRKIPRYVWQGVAAAAVFILCFFILTNIEQEQTSEHIAMVEEDTFDTPEEAFECTKESFEFVLLAVNSANRSRREINDVIEQSINALNKKENSNK
ncbi:MAG: hypothetical protein J6V00_06095 [Bacteroidaceae bacterium]|nr:hypothetical protein [Bacteroidaceae bacterium]